jgi:endo-1,4-beta-xylanase
MVSLKLLLTSVCACFSVAQGQFVIQNWGNGNAATNYTYKSLTAGRYTVDWILGAGGNFVVGKGYRGNTSLFVPHPHDLTSSSPLGYEKTQG